MLLVQIFGWNSKVKRVIITGVETSDYFAPVAVVKDFMVIAERGEWLYFDTANDACDYAAPRGLNVYEPLNRSHNSWSVTYGNWA